MRINARTFKAWMKANYNKATIGDIADYGANGGFPNLTYYHDTCKIYNKFEKEIWEALATDSKEGDTTIPEFIDTLDNDIDIQDPDTFKNLLVWYYAERTAREIVDEYVYEAVETYQKNSNSHI